MTLARTHHIGSASSTGHGTGTYTTGSFTPNNSSLLVVIASIMEDSGSSDPSGDLTVSDSAGLTWTSQATVGDASSWSIGQRVWTAPVTTGVSMTVTFDCAARNIYQYFVEVADYTGHGGVGQIGTNTTLPTDGAGTVTLAGSPAATSEIIGAIMQDATGTAGADPLDGTYTELYDIDSLTGSASQAQARAAGSVSASFSWADVGVGAGLFKATGIAIEITEAGGTTVTAQACTFTLSPQSGAVTVGSVTVTAQPYAFTLTPVAVTPTAGSVTVAAQPCAFTLAAQPGVVTTGAVTVTAQPYTFTLTPEAITPTNVSPGSTVTAQVCTFTFSPQAGTVTPGAVSVTAQACTFTLAPQAGVVTVGAVTVTAQPYTFTFSPQAGSITPGAITVTAQHYQFTLAPQQGTVATTTPGPTILGRFVYRWTEPGLFSGPEPSTARWAEPAISSGGDQ